jgi:hypothetical protein
VECYIWSSIPSWQCTPAYSYSHSNTAAVCHLGIICGQCLHWKVVYVCILLHNIFVLLHVLLTACKRLLSEYPLYLILVQKLCILQPMSKVYITWRMPWKPKILYILLIMFYKILLYECNSTQIIPHHAVW